MIKRYGLFFRKLVLTAILNGLFGPAALQAALPNDSLAADSAPADSDVDMSDIFLTDDPGTAMASSPENIQERIPTASYIDPQGSKSSANCAFLNLNLYLEIASGGCGHTIDMAQGLWPFTGSRTINFAEFGASTLTTAGLSDTNLPGNGASVGEVVDNHVITVPEPSGKGLFALGVVTICVIIYRRRAKLL